MCAVRTFQNVDGKNIEDWLQGDGCEPGFRHITDAELSTLLGSKREKKVVTIRKKEKVRVSVLAWRYSVSILY
jgi:hypothetical protein